MSKRKTARVEMIDKRGNIARPWPEDVAKWEAKGWIRVKPAKVPDNAQEGDEE
jgi:hypothetical protein